MKRPEGLQVVAVAPDGPAYQAGLRVQDVITKINGTDVNTFSTENVVQAFGSDPYTVDVDRPGGPVTITVHPLPYADLVKLMQH